MALELAPDCKHYLGDRPCKHKQRCRCSHYAPMGHRIAVIKLGALGDVVRTACLLPTLKREYPASHITWVSKPDGVRILEGHPQIDRRMVFDAETMLALPQQRFDLVLSVDKEPGPAALCNALDCPDKRGIGMSPWGTAEPINAACEPYFELGLDDELKFRHNRKSYPQLIHEALSLPYIRQPYTLYPSDEATERAAAVFQPWRAVAAGPMIGINTGSGDVFANKAPDAAQWARIARELVDRGYEVVLLGGPAETATNAWIAEKVGGRIHDAGCDNTEQQFTAIVGECDAVICGDTLALHVAISRRVPVVALFGPTCAVEIDLFGLGRKLVAPVDCGPCYRRRCERSPNCMDAIGVDAVVAAVEDVCRARETQRAAL